jgi:hypothetical protein
MSKELQEQHRLFSEFVLRVLEREVEWSGDIVDEIADAAMDLCLAHTDNEGKFKVTYPFDK